jgi:hypothetical protein
MPYGEETPVLHASAGVRRITSLAYLLVWTWKEHLAACKLLGEEPASQVVFLVDEIEAHLHPRWQRSVVRSLLSVVTQLARAAQVQIIAATHSPLVMASVEPEFDTRQDAWFDFDLVRAQSDKQGHIALTRREWQRHGEASAWLMSNAFDMKSARSIEAEQALEEAAQALSAPNFNKTRAKAMHAKLAGVLSDTDPFWVRWRYIGEKKGWLE